MLCQNAEHDEMGRNIFVPLDLYDFGTHCGRVETHFIRSFSFFRPENEIGSKKKPLE